MKCKKKNIHFTDNNIILLKKNVHAENQLYNKSIPTYDFLKTFFIAEIFQIPKTRNQTASRISVVWKRLQTLFARVLNSPYGLIFFFWIIVMDYFKFYLLCNDLLKQSNRSILIDRTAIAINCFIRANCAIRPINVLLQKKNVICLRLNTA